jgi:hypothetical protein
MRRSLTARPGRLLVPLLLGIGLLGAGCGDDGGPTTDPNTASVDTTTPQLEPTNSLQQGTDENGSTIEPDATPGSDATSSADTPSTMDTESGATGTTPPADESGTGDDTADVNTGGSSSEDPSVDTTAEAAPIMLAVDDLPSGYSEKPYESENADCLGPALDPTAAEVHPPNAFEADSVAGEARSRAWDFASEEEAQAAFAAATGDEIEACIIQGAETDLQTDDFEAGGTAEARPLELEPVQGADDQAATTFAATFTPSGGEQELTAYSNIIVVQVGDTVAAYQFLTIDQPFSPADQQQAVAAAVARDGASA